MDTVTIAHAKEHLEDLIERARRGEDVRIVDDSAGAFRLTRVVEARDRPARRFGHLKGKIPPPPDDFFDPLSEDELKHWYGEAE